MRWGIVPMLALIVASVAACANDTDKTVRPLLSADALEGDVRVYTYCGDDLSCADEEALDWLIVQFGQSVYDRLRSESSLRADITYRLGSLGEASNHDWLGLDLSELFYTEEYGYYWAIDRGSLCRRLQPAFIRDTVLLQEVQIASNRIDVISTPVSESGGGTTTAPWVTCPGDASAYEDPGETELNAWPVGWVYTYCGEDGACDVENEPIDWLMLFVNKDFYEEARSTYTGLVELRLTYNRGSQWSEPDEWYDAPFNPQGELMETFSLDVADAIEDPDYGPYWGLHQTDLCAQLRKSSSPDTILLYNGSLNRKATQLMTYPGLEPVPSTQWMTCPGAGSE